MQPGDVVGIGIHTGNALRGYESAAAARARGAFVVFGGIHATLFPDEVREHGGAHAVVTGDGDLVWPHGARRLRGRNAAAAYDGGRVDGDDSAGAMGPAAGRSLHVGARCRRCAAARSTARSARSGAPTGRSRGSAASTRDREIVELRRKGFRFIAARRRQLLSGHARAICDGGRPPRRQEPLEQLRGAARRSGSS